MVAIDLADAKAHLIALVDRVENGETVEIRRRGKAVARLVGAKAPRAPIRAEELRVLTDQLPRQSPSAGEFVRSLRESDRY